MSKKYKLQQNEETKVFRIIGWEETAPGDPWVASYGPLKETAWTDKARALAVLKTLRGQADFERREANQYWVDVDENEEYSS